MCYLRDLYKSVVLPIIPNIENLDNDRYITDISERKKNGEHEHSFWYCVDICWKKDIVDPNVDMCVCLFQCLFYNLINAKFEGSKEELELLQSKVRRSIISYMKESIVDFEDQICKYNESHKIDLLSDSNKDWWKTFA